MIEVLDIQGSGSTIDSVLKGILPIGAMAGAAVLAAAQVTSITSQLNAKKKQAS